MPRMTTVGFIVYCFVLSFMLALARLKGGRLLV